MINKLSSSRVILSFALVLFIISLITHKYANQSSSEYKPDPDEYNFLQSPSVLASTHQKENKAHPHPQQQQQQPIVDAAAESVTSLVGAFVRGFITVLLIISGVSVSGLFLLFVFLLLRRGEPTVISTSKFVLKENTNTSAGVKPVKNVKRREHAKTEGECQWLNFILKRAAAHFIYKHTNIIKQQLLSQLNKELNLPDVVGTIDIIDLNFGSNTPTFYAIKASEDKNGMILDIDLEFEDPDMKVHLGTDVFINFPVKKFASLPVQFSLENIYFHAKLRITISDDFSEVKISFTEEPDFDMLFTNEIGSRRTIKNLPWITDLINRALYTVITKVFVSPKFLSFKLPPLVLFSNKNDEKITVKTEDQAAKQAVVEESSSESESSDEEIEEDVNVIRNRKTKSKYRKDFDVDQEFLDFLEARREAIDKKKK